METIQFTAPCLFGVEGILADELRRMGAGSVTPQNGRVDFTGDLAMLARANIGSRYAERVCLVIGSFRAVTFEELFQGTRALPWERWIGKKNAFPVTGWSLDSKLFSVPDCQSIIKKAAVEHLKEVYGLSWFDETDKPCQIRFSILKDVVTLMLDTSGVGLHKRGYRAMAGGAPIKETLAAAMCDVMRARKAGLVCDPCCGSGTLLIEAAMTAKGIAPGIGRRFAAMDWGSVDPAVWREERDRARGFERRENPFEGVGGDIDPAMVELTLANAAKAGVGDCIRASVADVRQFSPVGDTGLVLCNPPYGERLLDIQAAEELYGVLGRVLPRKAGWNYAVISPDETFETCFGRPADKRRKLYNGMIKCQLYMYFNAAFLERK